jgi:hypothetical protein
LCFLVPHYPNNYGIPGLTTSSILTATGSEYFTIGFFGILSDDPILSVTRQADHGEVPNTGIDNIRLSENVVPEPGTLLLIGSGLTALALRRRRRS